MPKRKHGLEFKGNVFKLMELYHLDEPSKTPLGNMTVLPLRAVDGVVRDWPPSLENLCIHFGEFQVIDELVAECKEKGVSILDWEERAMQEFKKQRIFEQNYIQPIRRYLEGKWTDINYPQDLRLWFYCVPRGDIFSKNPVTGEIEYSWNSRQFVLCLLPMTVKQAEGRYQCDEATLRILAPQLAWLTVSFCQRRRLTALKEAQAMLGDWREYLFPPPLKALAENKIRDALYP